MVPRGADIMLGQKPGDVIMPNMKNMNIDEIMKDPKIQEMMKRQK